MTRRKSQPVEVTERMKGTVQSQELLGRLIESVRDYAIFLLDAEGRVATWNPGAERIKGYRAEEIIGEHFSKFYPEAEAASGKCEQELDIAAQEGRFEDEGWRVRKDGSQFWANVVISAVRGDRGELLGFAKITQDLTDRRRAEEERAARLAAEQASKAKDEFLAMLGHELRNPLAPIVTALQLMKLRNEPESNEQQIIERQVNHMVRLVDDLLDIAQITRGTIELRKQRVSLRAIVIKAIDVASPLLEQRRHVFEVELPDEDVFVHGDEPRLAQVFVNLLLNAAKYTEPGGRITVKVFRVGLEVWVEVRDNGCGIEPELLARVFELFVQGTQTSDRAGGGLGVGLALVRTLVHLHGGKVRAYSAGKGMGSAFTVRLSSMSAAAVETMARKEQRGSPGNAAETRLVLLVDDNEDALELLSSVLTGVGHDVRSACDAPTALDMVKTWQPEIAILDIGLPVMDGYSLAAALRAALGAKCPRMIALTGYGQQADRKRSVEAGFDAHLVKPVDTRQLIATIAELGR